MDIVTHTLAFAFGIGVGLLIVVMVGRALFKDGGGIRFPW